MERRTDRDWSGVANDNASDLLIRSRFGFEVKHKGYTGSFQMQVASDERWEMDGNRMIERRDARLANVNKQLGDLDVTLGRQTIKKGTGRLISEYDWNNQSQAFDAVRVQTKGWDFAGGSVAFAPSRNWETKFAYASYAGALGETMLFSMYDPDGEIYTLDHAAKLKQGQWSGDVELAVQSGNVNDKELSAAAGFGRAIYALNKKLDFVGMGGFATGGQGTNGSHTFSQNLGAYRGWTGVSNSVGWQNVQYGWLGLNYKPLPGMTIIGSYARYGLWNGTDAFYNQNGNRSRGLNGVLQDATGNSGRDIGDEFGVDAKWVKDEHVTYWVGFSVFRAGKFIKNVNGAGTKDQVFGFLMASYKF